MNYEEWNLTLGQHFFNEEMAGRQVLLYANEDLIRRLGGSESALADFVAAVRQGPVGATRTGFCQRALQVSERWVDRATGFPPFLAHLVFFVVAAGTEDDFADHAYYPRVWRLLGEDRDGAPPSFDQMINLWSDLEKWSREDRHEELGRFVAWPRGGWIHVGMPWSQRILSEDERKALPRIFYRAEFDPTAPPATDVLIRDLVSIGREFLRRQTVRLLTSDAEDGKAMRNALADLVLEELSSWNGDVPADELGEEAPAEPRVQTGLRICLDVDTFSRTARPYFRFKATRPFPAGGLHFDEGTSGQAWECTETHQGWSTPLLTNAAPGTQQRVDAASFDWKRGFVISDSETGWRARLRAADVRLFFPGRHENLHGWVEARKLQRERDFIVLAVERLAPAVRAWGAAACVSFSAYDVRGLPVGWIGFSGKGATKSCPNIDVLSLSPTMRLSLTGGVKTGRGNTYFHFAPPSITVENYSVLPTITLNGSKLRPQSQEAPVWALPPNLPLLTPLVIQVEEFGLKRVIRLQEPLIAPSWEAVPCRDSAGRMIASQEGVLRAQGASVDGQLTLPPAAASPHLPTYLASRIIFLGRRPGQVCEWPQDEVPADWHPAWALARVDRKRWKAHFCGTAEHLSADPVGPPLENPARLRDWKKSLCNLRRVTDGPELPRLRALWKQYIEAAERV